MSAPGTVPAAPTPGADDAGWVRVHPASPWIKGWVLVAGFFVFGARDTLERLAGALIGLDEADAAIDPASLWVPALVLLGAFVLFGLVFFASWWFTRFRVGEEQIELRQGWLFRSQRQMKYDRIQAVDLQYPLLARLLGLAAVKVEAADGGDTALELAYLTKARAAEVRREILDRASGALVGPAAAPERVLGASEGSVVDVAAAEADRTAARDRIRGLLAGPEDEGTVMLRVPTGRLIGSVLLSDAVVAVVAGFALAIGGLATAAAFIPGAVDEGEVTLGAGVSIGLPLVFSLVGVVWGGLNKGWGFTVRDSPDGLRLRYGLTETTSQTVPPGRVQGITVVQPMFWRLFGWHRVKVSVAGYGAESALEERDVALPVGPWEDVLRVLEVVAPDAGLDGDPRAAPGADGRPGLTPAGLMEAALRGSGEEHGFRHVPRRAAWWWNWLSWRRHGYTLTRTLLVVRHGRLRRKVEALQHERVQDVVLAQGPVQRRLDVASLTVHQAGAVTKIHDLDAADLRELFALESRHAAVSRRLADRNSWMLPEELARFERRTAEVAETAVGRKEMAAAGVVVDVPQDVTTTAPASAGPDRAASPGEEQG